MWSFLAKLGDAVYRRAHLRRELRRCARDGVAVPGWLAARALYRPEAADDLVDFLRFLRPEQRIRLIDIGANRGEWAADFLALFPDTAVLAVEPVPATFERLRARFAGDSRVRAVNAAVSDRGGSLTLRVGADDRLASLYDYAAPFTASRGQREGGEAPAVVTVPALPLDELPIDDPPLGGPAGDGGRVRVLKIDVQGHEPAVLAGGPRLLETVDVAIVELNFVEEYAGMEPSFGPCAALLGAAGLHPAIFQEYGRWVMPYAAERDVIFVRRHLLERIIG
jgi:FkbM family methyltransferase